MTNLTGAAASVSQPWDTRRWLTLGVIALAQLMVVLDVTIMNIALPSAQQALHFGTADRQWVVTAYTLAFGSLLLLGGRLADLLGRKVTFLTGLVGFAGVSAIGGASVNFAMLVTARACQGAFAAVLVPSALSLLTTTFSEPKDRGKAFGVYGAIAIAGGAVGLLLGGALTEYLSWRGPPGRGGGIGDGHRGPAARRLDRDVPVEHHFRQRRGVIPGRPPGHVLGRPSDRGRVGVGARLRHHLLVDRRDPGRWRHYRRRPFAPRAIGSRRRAVSGPRPGRDGAGGDGPVIV